MATKSFKDLVVWQRARDLAVEIYRLTEQLPDSERFGLASQMRRAAISVSSNITESYHRFHRKDKDHFLSMAFGSGSELESQLAVAKLLYPKLDYQRCEKLVEEVMKMLGACIDLRLVLACLCVHEAIQTRSHQHQTAQSSD
jgi:four helix bundle protein